MMHGMASNNRSQGGRPGMMRGGPMGRGGPMAMMKGEKPRDFKGTMRKLVQYLSAYRLTILVVGVFAIGSTIFTIVGPKIMGRATTNLFEGVMAQIAGTGSIDFTSIGNILLLVLVLPLGIATSVRKTHRFLDLGVIQGQPVEFAVWVTRHGPVISGVIGQPGQRLADGHHAAMRSPEEGIDDLRTIKALGLRGGELCDPVPFPVRDLPRRFRHPGDLPGEAGDLGFALAVPALGRRLGVGLGLRCLGLRHRHTRLGLRELRLQARDGCAEGLLHSESSWESRLRREHLGTHSFGWTQRIRCARCSTASPPPVSVSNSRLTQVKADGFGNPKNTYAWSMRADCPVVNWFIQGSSV